MYQLTMTESKIHETYHHDSFYPIARRSPLAFCETSVYTISVEWLL